MDKARPRRLSFQSFRKGRDSLSESKIPDCSESFLRHVPPSRQLSARSLKSSLKVKNQRDSLQQDYYAFAGNNNRIGRRQSCPEFSVPKTVNMLLNSEENDDDCASSYLRFAGVSIHYHAVILGDHPMATGAPLSLGWERVGSEEFGSHQEFEELKLPRPRDELVMTPVQRERLLLRTGVSQSEINQRSQELELQRQRRFTAGESIRRMFSRRR